MINSYGRKLHKLRLQLVDACNFRCSYCMPEFPQFYPASQLLKKEELLLICRRLVDLGVDEIRVTGGEPLLHPQFLEIVNGLSEMKLNKLGVTTNGFHLLKVLPGLKKTNLKHINVSLDSLNPTTFHEVTLRNAFDEVMKAILKAKEMGFELKINVVAMKGINDHEIFDYIEFSRKMNIQVRFLELMQIGPQKESFHSKFISMDDMMSRIGDKYLLKDKDVPHDNTAREFLLDNGASIGFIASETKSFCRQCSRLRLTVKGALRPCLFKDEEVNLRGLNEAEFIEAVDQVASKKPMERLENIDQPMYAIGG